MEIVDIAIHACDAKSPAEIGNITVVVVVVFYSLFVNETIIHIYSINLNGNGLNGEIALKRESCACMIIYFCLSDI